MRSKKKRCKYLAFTEILKFLGNDTSDRVCEMDRFEICNFMITTITTRSRLLINMLGVPTAPTNE